jgi:hypothetical protein
MERDHVEVLDVDGYKMDFEQGMKGWARDRVEGRSCEHSNQSLGSIKAGCSYQHFKKSFAPC